MSMTYQEEMADRKKLIKLIIVAAVAVVGGIIALSIMFGTYYTVDAGTRGVQTRFGSITAITDPGLHFKMPWIDSVQIISVRVEYADWKKADKADYRMEAYSHDQQPALMAVKLAYHIKGDDESVRRLFNQFRNSDGLYQAVLGPRTAQAVKTTFGQFTAVSVVQDRSRFNQMASKAVEDAIYAGFDGQAAPVVVDGVQIYDIEFSQNYIHAVEARMQAQVEVEKVAQNLERTRKEAEMTVVQAEAAARATLAQAKAAGEAFRLKGEGEAAAIRAKSAALQTNPNLVNLTTAERWNGQLPTTMLPGGTVPLLTLGSGLNGK